MPHLAHGLTGLAIGVASVAESRRPAVHAGWVGACVTLAYLPDLVEWLLVLSGVWTVRSAPASLLISGISALAVILLVRLGLRETRWPVLAAAAAAVLSHSLLDALDGGIPALWPWHAETFGWEDALGLDALRGTGRVHAEAVLFMPLLALGLLIRSGRLGREPDRLVALLAVAATFSAA
ncbi:MAG: metal-dependent hydrolase, partial [Phycisphaerae bacterium]|nr:metal-dependent hydrolase [Phycisphaerae bacterium]